MSEAYKPKASWFAIQGEKYLGRPYSEMDCQALVEKMLEAVGIFRNWRGSNHMWRDALIWKGTPEECIRTFGKIPVGAWLFVLKDDGGEVARGYKDGLGNASHVGVYTGTGKGAINSSSTKGKVAESAFSGKSINGGWNRVGLCKLLDYELEIPGAEETEKTKEDKDMTATPTDLGPSAAVAASGLPAFSAENCPLDSVSGRCESQQAGATRVKRYVTLLDGQSGTVNLRATRNGKLLERVKTGTAVEELKKVGDWSEVVVNGKTGWMMTKYLTAEPKPEPEEISQVNVKVGSEVVLHLPLDVARALYDALLKTDL